MKKRLRYAGVALAFVVIACGTICFFKRSAEPSIEMLRKAMTEEEIKSKFGRPDNVALLPSHLYDAKDQRCRASAARALVYYRKSKPPIVIYLDSRDHIVCAEERLVF